MMYSLLHAEFPVYSLTNVHGRVGLQIGTWLLAWIKWLLLVIIPPLNVRIWLDLNA